MSQKTSSSYQSFFVETTLYAAKLVQGKVRKYTRYQEEIKSAKPSAFNYTLQTGTGISVVRKHGLKGKNLNFIYDEKNVKPQQHIAIKETQSHWMLMLFLLRYVPQYA